MFATGYSRYDTSLGETIEGCVFDQAAYGAELLAELVNRVATFLTLVLAADGDAVTRQDVQRAARVLQLDLDEGTARAIRAGLLTFDSGQATPHDWEFTVTLQRSDDIEELPYARERSMERVRVRGKLAQASIRRASSRPTETEAAHA